METFEPNSFMNKLKLKEALFLMTQGSEATADTVDQILAQILPTSDNKNTMILRFKKTILQVLSAGKEAVEVNPMPGLAFRGEQATTFRIERTLDAHNISFILAPNADKSEIHLAVEVDPPASLRVKLKLDGDTIETLSDLRKEKMFDAPITTETAPEVVFFEQNKEIGRFHLILETD